MKHLTSTQWNRRALYSLSATCLVALASSAQAQTPIYAVNGISGTGGGTAGVSVTPSTAPAGSSALTLIAGSPNFAFGTGVNGAPGQSIANSGTYGVATSGVLGGTVANLGNLTQFTLTMWINPSASPAGNNTRLLDISSGTPSAASADGGELFFGINSGGGLQFYVNNVNPNSVGTDISTATVFNSGQAQINTWYFLAVTYDSVAGNYLLYSGNSTASSVAQAYAFSNVGSFTGENFAATSSIFLGNRPNGQRAFAGLMDDVAIYNGALSLSDLQTLHDTQLTPEPGTAALLGLGGVMFGLIRRRSDEN